MKQLWVEVDPYDTALVTCALESGAEVMAVPVGKSAAVQALGRVRTLAADGDLRPGRDVETVTIRDKQDEQAAAALPADRWVVITTTDWTVIPLENLVAQRGKLIARVRDAAEAALALGILEKGVDGILLTATTPDEIKKTAAVVRRETGTIPLGRATITRVTPSGMGDRVCVDTCSNLKPGSGMLVGNSTGAMFLVHSESLDTPYVNPRPFRVNAGPVHAYLFGPAGKTPYLSDLKAGDEVTVVDWQGRTEPAVVGRIKIEKRPLLLIEAELAGEPVSCLVQNAETIRLVAPDGKAVSVVNLQPGDEVLAYREAAGRHFGMKIAETITEK